MVLLGADGELDADLLSALLDDHVHDVGHANAGDQQSEDADQPEEDLDAEGDLVAQLLVLDEVPHRQGALVFRVELVAGAQDTVQLRLDELGPRRIARSQEQVVDVAVTVNASEGRGRDDRPTRVGAIVHAVLELLLHDADDRVRQVIQRDGLANRLLAAEQLFGDLVAQEQDAASFVEVTLVDETATLAGEHAAHVLESRVDTLHVGRRLVVSVLQRNAPAAVGRADQVDLLDGARDQIEVFLAQSDAAALGQALELPGCRSAVDHEDPLAGVEQAVDDGVPEPLAEGEQQHDGDGAPGDGEHGEQNAGFLLFQVTEEFAEEYSPHSCSLPLSAVAANGHQRTPDS